MIMNFQAMNYYQGKGFEITEDWKGPMVIEICKILQTIFWAIYLNILTGWERSAVKKYV